jgi:hypothetical protein
MPETGDDAAEIGPEGEAQRPGVEFVVQVRSAFK